MDFSLSHYQWVVPYQTAFLGLADGVDIVAFVLASSSH